MVDVEKMIDEKLNKESIEEGGVFFEPWDTAMSGRLEALVLRFGASTVLIQLQDIMKNKGYSRRTWQDLSDAIDGSEVDEGQMQD